MPLPSAARKATVENDQRLSKADAGLSSPRESVERLDVVLDPLTPSTTISGNEGAVSGQTGVDDSASSSKSILEEGIAYTRKLQRHVRLLKELGIGPDDLDAYVQGNIKGMICEMVSSAEAEERAGRWTEAGDMYINAAPLLSMLSQSLYGRPTGSFGDVNRLAEADWMVMQTSTGNVVNLAERYVALLKRMRVKYEKDRCPLPTRVLLAQTSEPDRCPSCGFKFSCEHCVSAKAAQRWACSPSQLPDGPWCLPDAASTSGPSRSSVSTREHEVHEQYLGAVARASRSSVSRPFRPARRPTVVYHCSVCDEVISKPELPVTDRCNHAQRVCQECMRRYLDCHMHDISIRCPIPSCDILLALNDVKRWATPETFERFDQSLLRRHLAQEPTFSWCKNPACTFGQIHTPASADCTLVTCPACSNRSCSKHDIPWHEGLTCEQYDKRKGGWLNKEVWKERKVSWWVRRKTKQCPGCGKHIERAGGCDHITCYAPAGCGYHFCWRCGADYSVVFQVGNHAHKRWCKHYRPARGWRLRFWRRNHVDIIEVW